MRWQARIPISLDLVLAALGLFLVMLAVAWGYTRMQEEQEQVALTRQRLELLAGKLKQAPPTGTILKEALARGLILPEDVKDGWGRQIDFDETEKVFYSLGSDGLVGGNGYAADLVANAR